MDLWVISTNGLLVIFFNGISTHVDYLVPNPFHCIYDFMCIDILVKIIFIENFSLRS